MSVEISEAPLTLPSLDYHHAFDLCAMQCHQLGTLTGIYTDHAFCARELTHRLGQQIINLKDAIHPAQKPSTVIWAVPGQDQLLSEGRKIGEALALEAHLIIISAGWLSRFLPEAKHITASPAHPVSIGRWLRANQFCIQATHGFHGVSSIAWGYAGRLMENRGWFHLADRCAYRMRKVYSTRVWQAQFAPVAVIIAKKERI